MAEPVVYEIKYTSGLFLTSLLETAINETSTSITLFGRGTETYGQGLQQNLISMLENFAFSQAPKYPLAGQLWYDTSSGALHVFSGTSWEALLATPNTNLSLLVPGQITIVNAANALEYVSVSGDISLNDSGLATIVTDSNITISGDVFGTGIQAGKGDITVSTAISANAVGITHLDTSVREHALHGSLSAVADGRRFIVMKAHDTMALTSLILHTPNGTCTAAIEYNNASIDGDDMTTKTYTTIDTIAVTSNTFHEKPLSFWVAPTQGISIDFSGITGSIDEINYTLVYERV